MSSSALIAVDNAGAPGQLFHELLKTRRAVRSYTGERVSRETLERIARVSQRRRAHDEVVQWNRWTS
jgi:hypothetical protein